MIVASFVNRKAARHTGRLKPLFCPMHNVHANQVADVATCQLSKSSPRNAGFLISKIGNQQATTLTAADLGRLFFALFEAVQISSN